MFRHPKYYKELRKLRNRVVQSSRTASPQSDQAISLRAHDGECERAPGQGLKLPGPRPISNANKGLIHRRQATSSQASSDKPQAPSHKLKLQAASDKLTNLEPFIKFQATSIRGLD